MRRLSERLPVVLLGLATVFGAVGVTEAWRAARSNQSAAQSLLRDYGSFAAWTFSDRAVKLLDETVHHTFYPLWNGRRAHSERPDPFGSAVAFRTHVLRDPCGCGVVFPAAFHFRLPLVSGKAEFAGKAPAPRTADAISNAILADAPRLLESQQRERFATLSAGGETVVYTVHRRLDGSHTAYGFSLDAETVTARVAGVMSSCSLLPPVLMNGRENEKLLALALIGPDGKALFESGMPDLALAGVQELEARFGGMYVRASVLPEVAADLIIGGLPGSRLPLMIGVFVLAVLLAGVAVVQLRRAQDLARLRSDFVAGVSHELRTPLAQIRIYTDTLALGRAEAEDRRAWSVDGLRREATRLEHLVDNILQFARTAHQPNNGAAPLIELVDVVEQATDAYRPLAARRAILEVETTAESIAVRIAADAMRQILGNLLDNAVKYGPRDQTIRVRVSRAGPIVAVSVEDQGPGVPVSERELVWEMYRRGARAMANQVGGSGIGLAVVRRIALAHGGRTRIEDAPGGGARVIVELPIERVAMPTVEETADDRLVAAGAAD
jgi:signal transduction histidine kinase